MKKFSVLLLATVILSSCNLDSQKQISQLEQDLAFCQKELESCNTLNMMHEAELKTLHEQLLNAGISSNTNSSATTNSSAPIFARIFPSKMNVFYVGVDNPVEIENIGIPANEIEMSINSGSIRRANGTTWIVNVKTPGEVTVNWSAVIEGENKSLGSRKFKVKSLPDPRLMVGNGENKHGGIITKSSLIASPLKAEVEDFDFDFKYVITQFAVSATIKGFTKTEQSSSNKFTAEQQKMIQNVPSGGKIYIEDVVVKGPDGRARRLDALKFTIR